MTPSLLDLHRAVLVPIDAVFAQLYEMMSEIISFPCGFGKWLASLLALLFVPLLALLTGDVGPAIVGVPSRSRHPPKSSRSGCNQRSGTPMPRGSVGRCRWDSVRSQVMVEYRRPVAPRP